VLLLHIFKYILSGKLDNLNSKKQTNKKKTT